MPLKNNSNNTPSVIQFVWQLTAPHRKKMFIGILFLISVNLLLLTTPLILSKIIDTYNMYTTAGSINVKKVVYLSLLLLAISSVIFCLRLGWRALLILPAYKITRTSKNNLFSHIMKLCQKSLTKNTVGERISIISRETDQLSDALSWGTLALVDGILSIILVYIVLIYSYRQMAWASMLIYPSSIIFVFTIWKKIGSAYAIVEENIARISELTREMLQNIGTIKSFNSETYYINRFYKIGNKIIKANMKISLLEGILWPLTNVINIIAIIFALVLSIEQIKLGNASLGDLAAVLSYLLQVQMPFLGLSFALDIQQRGFANAKRIQEMLHTSSSLKYNSTTPHIINKPPDSSSAPTTPLHTTQDTQSARPSKLSLQNITFNYAQASTTANTGFNLGPLSLDIYDSEMLGITGRIGSGKTTLGYLLAHVYDLNNGTIYLDNTDINNFTLVELHTKILLQTQQFQLFSWTLAQNILFTEDEISDTEYQNIKDFGILAGLESDVALLPQQWDTLIGEAGILLSGGQKQRVALARAILIQTPVLILDDIFSGIDYKNALKIIKNLRTLRKNLTTIIISHNLALLSNTDRIIVMDNGKITEEGTHTSLLNNPKSIYAESWHKYLISQGKQLV